MAGFVGGILALAIPGIGPAIAAGPFAVALGGAAVGAAAGTLVGVLQERGVSEEEAAYYHEGIRRGGVLVSVETTEESVDRVHRILEKHSPMDIEEHAESWRASGWNGGRVTEREFDPIGTRAASAEKPGLPHFVKEELGHKRERRTVRTYTTIS